MGRTEYQVKPMQQKNTEIKVTVPGSKSLTNRALLLAALANGATTLKGALFSDDSRHFVKGLEALGYQVSTDIEKKTIRVERPDSVELSEKESGVYSWMPRQEAEVYVGSAGTAARFMTAMLAFAGGRYTLDASEQMKKRPMKPLLNALVSLGVRVTYLEAEGCFPFVLESEGIRGGKIEIDIGVSSQFLSALLMTGGMLPEGLEIHLTGERKSLPYVEMTAKLMERFGGIAIQENDHVWRIPAWDESDGEKKERKAIYQGGNYDIEPDVSGACYFYAMAVLTGRSVCVRGVHPDSLQGDKKFLQVLEKLGCQVTDTTEGICVTGPESGHYPGLTLNMNDFSDQTMTMAVVAAFADSPTTIEGIGHIRFQESNRILAVKTELERLGIRCEEHENGLTIYPGVIHGGRVQTYEDHRMAMAFALIGLRVPGIVIDNPDCCAKTFENYFDLLDEIHSNR